MFRVLSTILKKNLVWKALWPSGQNFGTVIVALMDKNNIINIKFSPFDDYKQIDFKTSLFSLNSQEFKKNIFFTYTNTTYIFY